MNTKLVLTLLFVATLSKTFVKVQADFNTTENYVAVLEARVPRARGLLIVENGDILTVAETFSRITAIYKEDNSVKTVLLLNNRAMGLTHGIEYRDGYLYASSESTVYRWAYQPGQRSAITVAEEIVISGMPTGGHKTRTLLFDKSGLLYVAIGSNQNVDPDSSRARIRRFDISSIPSGGIPFNTGLVFADGLRNEVGITFDEDGVLWGVQNGADDLFREDLGGDIHNENPAEELTKYDKPIGTFYGYPYCWTVDQLPNHEQGEQFAWPTFMNDGIHTDAWCKNVSNNQPPTMSMPAHWAPLGIVFYDGKACNSSTGAFPCSMKGDAFVAFHGAWNRRPVEGFRVARLPINPQTKLPTGEILNIMYEPNPTNCGRCFRPVDLKFDQSGHLIVTSDNSGEVFRLTWDENRH